MSNTRRLCIFLVPARVEVGKVMSKFCFVVAIIAALAGQSVATAAVFTDLPSWQAAAGKWQETTSLGQPDGTVISGVTLADGTTLGFAQALQVQTMGIGWATWCCGYAGNILESYGTGSWTTENWSISPVSGFGMFIEPDPFGILAITLTLSNGGTVTQNVEGDSGAAFFGWVGTGVTGLTISSSADFAEGDFFSSTPEPAYAIPVGFFLAGLVLWQFRHRRNGLRD
jgi:hypothetical protein